MAAIKPINTTTTPDHETLRAAFVQGGELEAARAYLGGGKEALRRQRVRGVGGAVVLETYRAASRQANLFEEVVVAAVAAGASLRGVARGKAGALGKSAAARMWAEASAGQLGLLRSRDLSGRGWLALMVDGVFLGDELCVVVAVGIDAGGEKVALAFGRGTSESKECVGRLLERLPGRGFAPAEGRHGGALGGGRAAASRGWLQARQGAQGSRRAGGGPAPPRFIAESTKPASIRAEPPNRIAASRVKERCEHRD